MLFVCLLTLNIEKHNSSVNCNNQLTILSVATKSILFIVR